MEKASQKYCITIVQEFSSEFMQDGVGMWIQQLKDLGISDLEINQLMINNFTTWRDYDLDQQTSVFVEIIKHKAMT